MSEKIVVPALGESVTEATVSKWLKNVGEKVDSDEPVVELETDKVNVEVPSPTSGVLGSITVKEGETVNVGSLLGTVDSASSTNKDNTKEVSAYNPPKKKKDETKVKIFSDEEVSKPKKTKPRRSIDVKTGEVTGTPPKKINRPSSPPALERFIFSSLR